MRSILFSFLPTLLLSLFLSSLGVAETLPATPPAGGTLMANPTPPLCYTGSTLNPVFDAGGNLIGWSCTTQNGYSATMYYYQTPSGVVIVWVYPGFTYQFYGPINAPTKIVMRSNTPGNNAVASCTPSGNGNWSCGITGFPSGSSNIVVTTDPLGLTNGGFQIVNGTQRYKASNVYTYFPNGSPQYICSDKNKDGWVEVPDECSTPSGR